MPFASKWSRRLVKSLILVIAGVVLVGLGYVVGGRLARRMGAPEVQNAAPTGEGEIEFWTCSMHPQVRREEPGLCPICNMELIPVRKTKVAALRQFATSPAGRALMQIQVSPVERKYVAAQVRMVGKVTYDETRLAYITAWVPGRIDRLFVDYTGITVNKGEHMVELYSPDLLSAQEELLQALKAVRELQGSELKIIRDSAATTVESVREKLRLWGLTKEQIAEVEQRGTASDRVTIYAPAGGVVIHKNATEGMYVQTGTKIYTIADLNRVWVMMDAYESDLMWLRYGQDVVFTTEAYPGEEFHGRIAFIDPVIDPKTRTVPVRVNLDNAERKLKPDMFVRAVVFSRRAKGGRVMESDLVGKWMCSMHPEVIKDAPGTCDVCGMALVTAESLGYVSADEASASAPLVIPATAPLVTGKRAVVYVEVPGAEQPTYEGRQILLGPRAGDYYIVHGGLREGERVVTQGNFKIDSALQIRAQPSMMDAEGASFRKVPEGGYGSSLPADVVRELEQIRESYRQVAEKIQGDDLDAIRGAFTEFGSTLSKVDAERIVEEKPRLLWQELAMLLRNDALEGREYAETLDDVRQTFAELKEHMQRLEDVFGSTTETKGTPGGGPMAVPAEFRAQLRDVWRSYQAVGQALADDRPDQAAAAAKATQQALAAVDMKLLNEEAHRVWMADMKKLDRELARMSAGEELAGQREAFSPLSDEMAAAVRTFGLGTGGPIYRIRCPMAFNNRGASWLQSDTEVRNPYFGAAMPGCGEVVETIDDGNPAGGPHGDDRHD